jgi:hypothetical protein
MQPLHGDFEAKDLFAAIDDEVAMLEGVDILKSLAALTSAPLMKHLPLRSCNAIKREDSSSLQLSRKDVEGARRPF